MGRHLLNILFFKWLFEIKLLTLGQLEKEHRQVLWVTEGVVSGTHYNNDDKNNDITNRGNFPPHNFLVL